MNTRNTQTTSGTENRLDRYGNPPLTPEEQAINDRVNAMWRKMYDDLDGPPTPEQAERVRKMREQMAVINGNETPRVRAFKEKHIARQKAKEQQGG